MTGHLPRFSSTTFIKSCNVKSSKSNAKSNSRLRISWYYNYRFTDHKGNLFLKPPFKQGVLSEDVPVQWSKKCVGYEETKEGGLVFFKDRSREFCDILVGADGINSPEYENEMLKRTSAEVLKDFFISPFLIYEN
ncbi:hypothetical protein GLOIN_2v1481333 [Rhizophagus irregularis DAOM 181602=DAOM 197198]|uniref:FAD-binding domain-containing protein n=1 Tax=Rhizophagus irregularis (strain DAOM 181602 / DAOM 197198 / MUCL 43194) TaxID=747089 RepID=A0A2P4PQX3_RHIID|nr:hypothetical protein GLOIN_2v1481333 [Rhizophagus irregularis DAOM 181602=DAOM 197198]POG67767.1 hypothetical protein GLOIN_2v1481333 [Rhizophagus irregularis DAOM 181602=DAOM 197198]|eukprot:XP_025174633.1 hypothetical protein GLOIN_2v1481333 [Rhizophagus irregularis DAOM 181602=DAOM 197198]